MIGQFVNEVLEGTITYAKDTETMVKARIAQLDALDLGAAQRGDARPRVPEARGVLARPELPGAAVRDQRHAEDQGPQHLEEGAGEGSGTRARIRPERDVQEDLRGGVRRLRWRAVRRRWSATSSSATIRRTSPCSRRSRTSRRRPTRRSSPRPSAKMFGLESFTELGEPRDLAKIFDSSSTTSGSRSARARIRATSACACRTC